MNYSSCSKAVNNFTIYDKIFNETTIKGEELFDYNNGRLIKSESNSNVNTFLKPLLINTIQMKIKTIMELINNSKIYHIIKFLIYILNY